MADDNSNLMAEFEEFLNAKRDKESSEAADEDYDVEIWDEKGRGARVRRSHAKPFLQSLGIDVDAPSGDTNNSSDNAGGDKTPKSSRKSTPPANNSSVRRYFAPKK